MPIFLGLVDTITTLFLTTFLPPFCCVVLLVVVLASLGKTIGLREKYVKILVKLFEYGKKRLAKNRKYITIPVEEEKEEGLSSRSSFQDIFSDNEEELCFELHEFHLSDSLDYISKGMEAIVDDEVTKRFTAEELTSWNFLTRTNCQYEFISMRLTVVWAVGFAVRYFVLLPVRICILAIGMSMLVFSTYIVGCLPNGPSKKKINKLISMYCFDFLSGSLSLVCTYHNRESVPECGICVANHTSPMDVLVLACDNAYDMVGQRHGGFLGIFQRALSRASDHIWFERGEVKDRFAVAKRLRDHVEDPEKSPILIFPEGTCINNTSVMQFKKGTFEVGGTIYPVAIKYDPRFGDAFWNSSKFSMLSYIYMMMTSWAIVCDVWYLPPMTKKDSESSIEFANRVKAEIAKQGGLVDLLWDGALKRSSPKKEFKEHFQQEFSRRLKIETLNNSSDQSKPKLRNVNSASDITEMALGNGNAIRPSNSVSELENGISNSKSVGGGRSVSLTNGGTTALINNGNCLSNFLHPPANDIRERKRNMFS